MLQILQWIYQQIARYTYIICWLTIGIFGILTIYVRVKVIFLGNPDVGGIENNVIYSVLQLLAGNPLYQNPEQAPYAITQYSPMYYYLTAGLSKLAGLTPEDVYEVYIAGRCVSFAANGLYVWGLIRLARRLQLPTSLAVLTGILAFVLLPPQSYGRPDSLYNALVIWTIWAASNQTGYAGRQTIIGRVILTALLAATALFSKQSAICLPVIVGGYFVFFSRNPRHVLPFLVWYTLFLALFYLSFFGTETTLIYANLVQGISNGIDLANFRNNLIDHYLRPFVWLVIPGLAISIRYAVFEQSTRQFVGVANVGLFLFAMATGLKWGSALNYFTEFTGLSCLLIADALWQLRHIRTDWANLGRLSLALGIVWVVPVNAMNFNWLLALGKNDGLAQYKQEQIVAKYVKDELKNCANCLVYNTLHNSSYLNTLLFKYTAIPQQDILVGSAYSRKTFNYSALDEDAKNGKIHFLISRDSEVTSPLSPPIYFSNYQPVKLVAGYKIFKFKTATDDFAQTRPIQAEPIQAKP